MRLGALLALIGSPDPAPSALADRARQLVGEGYESLWVPQAIGRGFMLSDPFVALTVAATATEGVELGTAVLQAPLYHPVDLAHRILSTMQVCGDRLRIGLGVGSTQRDFDSLDGDYESRFRRFGSDVERLRSLLATGASDEVELTPWPATRGGPPLLLGSWGAGVARAASDWDGWIASAMHRSPDEVLGALARYSAAGGGRAIVSTIRMLPSADLGEVQDELARYADAGFDDAVVFFLPGGPAPSEVRALVG